MNRYKNFASNLAVLEKSDRKDLSNEFIVSGIIDKFMLQFEFSWKLLKELLKYEGSIEAASGSPRQIVKASYRYYDFIDEKVWLDMLEERNRTAHIYDGNAALNLVKRIISEYIPEFQKLQANLEAEYGDMLQQTRTLLQFDIIDLDQPVPEELKQQIEKDGIELFSEGE